jgi:hypothetical protein
VNPEYPHCVVQMNGMALQACTSTDDPPSEHVWAMHAPPSSHSLAEEQIWKELVRLEHAEGVRQLACEPPTSELAELTVTQQASPVGQSEEHVTDSDRLAQPASPASGVQVPSGPASGCR